jgi:hypothetical protein
MNGNKEYFVPVPDNNEAFYAFVNLVINNKNNARRPNYSTERPNKIGPVKVEYVKNEVNESLIRVENNKEKVFVQMIIDQFCLLHTYWSEIENFIKYSSSDKFL